MAVPVRLAIAALVLSAMAVRADEPAKSKSIDPAKLPPNAIIIVSDKPADALQNVDAVVLSPDEYKKLLDAAAEAKRSTTPDRPEPPSVCRLSGKFETRGNRDVAVLRAEFQFRTTAPRSTVLLGLQKGKPVAATIDDGKLAVLVPLKDDDAFAVTVDTPGEHRVTVDLESPITSRGGKGNERGVELGLPGAAITTIQKLALPTGVTRVRLAGRSAPARQFAVGTESAPAFLLGPATKLDLSWDTPPSVQGEPQTQVEGRYDVRVEDHSFLTRARLVLKVQNCVAGSWDIQVPPAAELSAEGSTPESPVRIQKPAAAGKPWTVRRDPSATDLVLDVTLRTPLAKGKPVVVPAFAVAGSTEQRGTITIGGPPHLRLTYHPSAELTRRESSDEANHDAVFSFFRLSETGSLLTIDVQPARGDVETQVFHQLTLGERGWRWQGKFDVRPIRTELTAVDLELPAELQDLRSTSAELVEGITQVQDAAGDRPVVRVQLAEGRRKAFTFTLEGLYPLGGPASSASLILPRLLGTLDRGGQLAATTPAGLELRGSFREWEAGRPGEWERPLDPAPRGGSGLMATVDRAPARIDLTWRTPRSDQAVTATVDIQLGERQSTVRHQWHVPAGPRQFTLRGPASLAGRLRAIDGGTLTSTSPGEWAVQLTGSGNRESVLTVAYGFQHTPPGVVPLVWLEPCPRCETDVRIYSAATPTGVLRPTGIEGPWAEVPPRPVADRPALPALALHGSGAHLPLTLHEAEYVAPSLTSLVVERTWIQAVIDADGRQAYRARYLVRPLQTHYLSVELPAAPAACGFVARLDGKQMPWTPSVTDGNVVQLRLSAKAPALQELELVYALPPDASRWRLALKPPRLDRSVLAGPTRWQVATAGDDLLLGRGDTTPAWQWEWQRGLLAPRPAWSTTDLRTWFRSDAGPANDSNYDSLEATIAAGQPGVGPIQLFVVSKPLALLLGSLAALAMGWAGIRLDSAWRVAGVAVLAAGFAALAILRPQWLAVFLYAAQPGMAVLVVLAFAWWAAQRRYRRRVLFLPAFTRTPPTPSSHARNGATGSRPRREPTTIDAPAPHAIQ
jgi:hypothetical protein